MHRIIEKNGLKTSPGNPYLFGAEVNDEGCNFALFSKHAKSVSLLFFKLPQDSEPTHILSLDEGENKTGDVWHIFVFDIKPGQFYGYIVDGPYWPEKEGHRFNENKLLIDPYAKAITGEYHWDKKEAFGYRWDSIYGDLSFCQAKNYDIVAKSVVVDNSDFDWQGDKPLNIPLKDSIIYEMHVRAFTMDSSSGAKYPGTYRGIIEKIPYLKELGITTIELLPIHSFNPFENIRINPLTGERLTNFWGYSTLGFFAPQSWYAEDLDGINAVYEFKEMVKALHAENIEVILDVVYNHTAEGNEYGPTINFKGLDNSIYYMLEDGRYYKNYSGCGNTLNCNHPVVKRLIKDSLRYWVIDMHVDGFRFDLAAILGRDKHGNWQPDYSVLSEISHDPFLSNTKIIAEGWDAAGLYQVGGFPPGWAEWNAKFRDDTRGFVKGDRGLASEVSKRITGSADLFYFASRKPYHSINFITAHDGFTLNDLVSYNEKHNEQNGEENSDGHNHNISWNCGVEGPTDDPEILALRDRLMKNMFTILMISQGTPMILAGDEMKYSKKGNNNTYCHDNYLNWIDWSLLKKHKEYFEFCKYLIHFRRLHPVLKREGFLLGTDTAGNNRPDISWHGININQPDWSSQSLAIAFMMDGARAETGADVEDNNIYVAINSYWEDLNFNLPLPGEKKIWYKAVDTSLSPGYFPFKKEERIPSSVIKVCARSIVILLDR
ncbi:MAG: glycogen debranching protein GlgX [Spirochaetes bacterium]|nr:glycogen debranching protein GlgX [Spirochaetota bacterium]